MQLQFIELETNNKTKLHVTGRDFQSDKCSVNLLDPDGLRIFKETENTRSPIVNPMQWADLSAQTPSHTFTIKNEGNHGLVWDGNEMFVTFILE